MASIGVPSTMKGIIIEKTGGAEVLQYRTDLPVPIPKEGEVLVKNEFVGINFIDINLRSGLYPIPLPYSPGVEAEGVVISLPSPTQTTLKLGSRVTYIGSGAYAEYSAVSIYKLHVLPPYLAPGLAAASLSQGLTALTFINKCYHVQKDDWILVQAASSGVGIWLCRLLKSVGSRVIGTVSSDAKLELVKKHGAEFTINYSNGNVIEKVMELTGGKGVSAVFDSIGATTFSSSMQSLVQDGTMVSIGNTSGAVPPFSIAELSKKNLKILKPSLFGYMATQEDFVGWSEKLFEWVVKEEVEVEDLVWKTYPLEEARLAHEDLENRKTSGKLLLRV